MQKDSDLKREKNGASDSWSSRVWGLSQKLMLGAALLVLLTVGLTGMMVLRLNLQLQTQRVRTTLHDLGVMLAENPLVLQATAAGVSNKSLDMYLDSLVAGVLDLDIVTLSDANSKRLYHVDKTKVGLQVVGGDDARARAGEAYFSHAVGTMGEQLRFFMPIWDKTTGKQLGFVVTGALASTLDSQQTTIISEHVRILLPMLAFALVCAWFGARQIKKKSLLGYEPVELSKFFLERDEVLNSLEEGIIAVDVKGVLTLANKAALGMLHLYPADIGAKKLDDLYPQIRVGETLNTGRSYYNNGLTFGDTNVLCDRIPIREGSVIIGAVAILRNRTELTHMAEELTGVNHMIDALRSNSHEFMNKLHVILGLLRIGATDEAEKYIAGISQEQSDVIAPVLQKIHNKALGALILGKMSHCRELDIKFNLAPTSAVPATSSFLTGESFITLVGNLMENAIEAVNAKPKGSGEREVTLMVHEDDRSLMISVDDTGAGMNPEDVERVRKGGYSTKGRNRGIGMRLIQSVLASNGGEMQIDTEKDVGTSITVCFTRRENCD